MFKKRTSVLSSLAIRRRSPRIFRFDKTRAVKCFKQLQKRSVIGYFRFLIQLLISMKFYMKYYVH